MEQLNEPVLVTYFAHQMSSVPSYFPQTKFEIRTNEHSAPCQHHAERAAQ